LSGKLQFVATRFSSNRQTEICRIQLNTFRWFSRLPIPVMKPLQLGGTDFISGWLDRIVMNTSIPISRLTNWRASPLITGYDQIKQMRNQR
jgi:hypothetical protein